MKASREPRKAGLEVWRYRVKRCAICDADVQGALFIGRREALTCWFSGLPRMGLKAVQPRPMLNAVEAAHLDLDVVASQTIETNGNPRRSRLGLSARSGRSESHNQ